MTDKTLTILKVQDLNHFFKNVDLDNFIKNQDFYLNQPYIDVDINSEEFKDYLTELLKIGRGDLFRHFADTTEKRTHNKLNLYYAIKSRDPQTVKALMVDDVYEVYAALSRDERSKLVRYTLRELIKMDLDLAAQLMRDYHRHGVSDKVYTDIDWGYIAKAQNLNFIKAYHDCGNTFGDAYREETIFQAARQNRMDVMDYFASRMEKPLANCSPHQNLVFDILVADNVDCYKRLYEFGYDPKLEEGFKDHMLRSARSVEMAEFMRSVGYKMPDDKSGFTATRKTAHFDSYLNRYYLYQDICGRKDNVTNQDLKALAGQDLAVLRKPQTLPSGMKGRGITLATLAGAFNIVAQAAKRHHHPAPFDMRDLFCYDDKLKFKPFDVLMARDEGHHLFKPDLWGFDKEKVNYVWKLIPAEKKQRYKADHQNALKIINARSAHQNRGKTSQSRGIRRRPKP
tara:strand:- start:1726 stop:3090 length:1365 start_codon:yes stop_codon:yes gene_type:complete